MDFLTRLNPQQRLAVEHTEGPLLILAGAGSGKTRVITYRITHLVRNKGVSPANILAVTFTNKAAGEMRERVMAMLDPRAPVPLVSTFHSLSVRLLRREGAPLAALRPGFTTRFSIYDEADQLSVVKTVFKQLGLDEKFLPYRGALARISHAKNHGIGPEEFFRRSTNPQAEKLAVIYEQYQAALRAANALDFDDLLLETVRLLRHDEDTRRRINERYHYLLVDEYQDTNRPQYELVRLLSQPRSNVCVVGDEDQSIYAWRGADIRNILDFERDYPGATLIRLEQNYRSTKNILDAAGRVVAHNTERKGKKLWTQAGAGTPLLFYCGDDAENEALFIADYIQKYLSDCPADRVAVLYRTNFQSRQIEEALRRYGRKYTLVGGLSFYQRAEVKDVLAYLKAAVAPEDSISLLRIINTPARGIGKSTVEQIERHALERGLSVWGAIEDLLQSRILAARAQSALAAFHGLMAELRSRLGGEPLHETLVWIKERTGYQRMLEQEDTVESESRLANIDELINAAADAAERGETVHEFLDHAALVADTDDLDEAAQVTLLTLHSAKGLEFSLVILAGMEEGLFPHARASETESGIEEERRLCYVGMTRAQKQLVLTQARCRRRFGGGELEGSIPSRFLQEVPPELVEDLTPEREYSGREHGGRFAGGIDLYAEQRLVREMARRSTYTGKTYNSVENIAEFFASRGIATRDAVGGPAGTRRGAFPGRTGEASATARSSGAPAGSAGRTPTGASGTPLPRPRSPEEAQAAGRPGGSGWMSRAEPGSASGGAGEASRMAGRASSSGRIAPAGPGRVTGGAGEPAWPPVGAAGEPGSAPAWGATGAPQAKARAGFRAGARVHHPKYGTGTVLRREGEGDDAKITVSFPQYGVKKLIQKYATLRQE